jgi:hypothetical protein
MERYNLCGLSLGAGCGLRPIADRQRPLTLEIKEKNMPKAVFAAALAVGLVIALMPQLISSAAAQQKTIASDKNAKTKQGAERRAARRARAAEKMCRRVERKRKPPTRSRWERRGQNSGVTATSVSSPIPNSSSKILSALEQT